MWQRLDDIRPQFQRFPALGPPTFQGRSALKPVAAFTLVNSSVTALTVQAFDNSFDPKGGQIVDWLWAFGDGSTSTYSNPAHTYASADSYLVSLRVIDDSGLYDYETTSTKQEFVDPPDSDQTVEIAPLSLFTWTQQGSTVTFTDLSSDSDGTVVSRFWNFGEIPTSAFSYQLSGSTVTFTDQSTDVSPGSITTWNWAFGDGSTSTLSNPVHAYSGTGVFPVTLTVTDNDGNTNESGQQVFLSSSGTGLPFGPVNFWTSTNPPTTGAASFDLSLDAISASVIISRLSRAAELGHKFVTAMTGGSHSNYITNGAFDYNKWTARMDTFNTETIKAAVATAVANGTLVGNSVIDEPHHFTWGGVVTKSLVDQMCTYAKSIFSTLPCGFAGRYDWRTSETFEVCDFAIYQYWEYMFGSDVTAFRDNGVSRAALDGVNVCFSLNVLDGGPEISGCPIPDTGGDGTFANHCRMNAARVESAGNILGSAGIGLLMWQYDTTMWSQSSYQAAAANIRTTLNALPNKSWGRP